MMKRGVTGFWDSTRRVAVMLLHDDPPGPGPRPQSGALAETPLVVK